MPSPFSYNPEKNKMLGEKKTWPRKHSQHKAFFSKELQLASIFWWFSCCFRTAFLENQLHDPTSFPATHTTRWPPLVIRRSKALWKTWLIFDCNLVKRKCFPRLPISCLSKESHQSERIIIVRPLLLWMSFNSLTLLHCSFWCFAAAARVKMVRRRQLHLASRSSFKLLHFPRQRLHERRLRF